MAKTKISEWSTTPASNTDIDGINIAEGCAPSGINDAIRDLMAQVRSWQSGASGDPFNGPMNGTIGATTAYSGAFTTVSATGVITSTLATGTAPLTIASTTKVANLNADLLDGADWASPAALGSTTPAAVSATTLSASSTVSGTGFSNYLASPPAIGGTTAAAGSFTTLTTSSTVTLNGGTANGVTYLNGSKQLVSGSALTFNGTNLGITQANPTVFLGASTSGFSAANRGAIDINGSLSSLVGFRVGEVAKGYLLHEGTNLYISNEASGAQIFQTNSTEVFRATSTSLYTASGINVGIGTSSPSYSLDVQKASGTVYAQVKRASQSTGEVGIHINGGTSGVQWDIYQGASSNLLRFYVDGTSAGDKMLIDTSGNLGLGVTPSAWASGSAYEVGSTAATQFGYSKNGVLQNAYYNGTNFKAFGTGGSTLYQPYAGAHVWYYAGSASAGTNITFTQAMTLASSGDFLVGQTAVQFENSNSTSFYKASGYWIVNHANGTSSGVRYTGFAYNGTEIGSITQNGTTAVLYNITSDQRLKENIQDADSASSLIDSLQVRQFDWKADGNHQRYGFVAQELVTVAPEAVHQPADTEEMMAVDYSKLVPMLVKEIQSLRQRVAQLETN